MKKYFCLAVSILVLFTACKKNQPVASKDGCNSVVYCYTTPPGTPVDSVYSSMYGTINLSNGVFTSITPLRSSIFTNQTAFNAADHCYYAYNIFTGLNVSSVLYRVDAAGHVTSLYNTGIGYFSSLTYNKAKNKLYAINYNNLSEVVTSSTSFSLIPVAIPNHFFWYGSPLTVDNTTGYLYYVTADSFYHTPNFYIEQYRPGVPASVTVATGTNSLGILGLKFNKNDNMLYAINEHFDVEAYDFIKIDPTTGSITTLSRLPFFVNVDCYSVSIDVCSNRYVISTKQQYGSPDLLIQLDMHGTVLQQLAIPSMYQGLQILE